MISYLVSLLDSLRDDSLFCYSVSLVGPVGVNILTVNYFVSSNFVVVSGTLLLTLGVLVGLFCGCECFLVALGLLGGLPYLETISYILSSFDLRCRSTVSRKNSSCNRGFGILCRGVREGFSAWILRGNGSKKEPRAEALGWMFIRENIFFEKALFSLPIKSSKSE